MIIRIRNFDHWREIARQAARQSGRPRVPVVAEPALWSKALQSAQETPLKLIAMPRLVASKPIGK